MVQPVDFDRQMQGQPYLQHAADDIASRCGNVGEDLSARINENVVLKILGEARAAHGSDGDRLRECDGAEAEKYKEESHTGGMWPGCTAFRNGIDSQEDR